ncbi:hypothetical protein QBC34DRAFT_144192 [Podospora aff. communis PSN243]|uniref:Uncharacterized protein n=1 Tax=Podospora aff. communis PSN243 TaxID=3040156 RepID=A0AAV9GFJ6_9PEZI|nr:hypothetical protein QBC34DRAFT_144192 [Podospora aff. communis PSN243]
MKSSAPEVFGVNGVRSDDSMPRQIGPQRTKTQPWRLFWPPTTGSDVYARLLNEHPEVLLWQFDVTRPFDRPWRQWTDRFQVQEGQTPLWSCANSLSHIASDSHRQDDIEDRQAGRITLDQQMKLLDLPNVQPESFNYLAPLDLYQDEKPYKCQLPGSCFAGSKMNNLFSMNYPDVVISNVSGYESLFSLDQSGFEFAKCPVSVRGWSDETVVSTYLPALVKWLKLRLDCQEVFCYAYNFRQHGNDTDIGKELKYGVKKPFFRVHCDSSEATCRERLRLYFPNRFNDIMTRRVRFLNVWRPLSSSPVEDCPLALCDFRTVDKEDLVPMDIVYPHFVDEAYEVRYNPSHRWFYKKGMVQEDVIVFKLFDNLVSEATVCPHSAFVDPAASPTSSRRSSIEVKIIVLG